MNFACSRSDLGYSYFGLTPHKINNDWYLYLDKGWIKNENYYYKGISSSWCKIYVNPSIRIETNKLRDFPIYYNRNLVTNFQKLQGLVPVDGVVEVDTDIKVSYIENFYPRIIKEQKTFEECHDILFSALVENIGTFSANNKKKVLIPKQGGIDTLTARSIFDYLGVPYEIFDLPIKKPTLSQLGSELAKDHWGFQQIKTHGNCVVVTGFYGDEWILRNPYYAHVILDERGIDIRNEFDKIENGYMKKYFENYRKRCSNHPGMDIETLITQICNDFQIWHLDETYFFSPLKHMSLLTLLGADTQTILHQVTDAQLSKSIIKKCSPDLLDFIYPLKNQYDPDWFPTNS